MKSSVALQASWDCIREIWRETSFGFYHFPPRKYSHTNIYLPISSIVSSALNICSGCHVKSSPLVRSFFLHWNVFPCEMCGRTLLASHFLFIFQFNFPISSVKCASSECLKNSSVLHCSIRKSKKILLMRRIEVCSCVHRTTLCQSPNYYKRIFPVFFFGGIETIAMDKVSNDGRSREVLLKMLTWASERTI